MSTVPEAIVANHTGMKGTLAISCVTSIWLRTGISPQKLVHQEVPGCVGARVRDTLIRLLNAVSSC